MKNKIILITHATAMSGLTDAFAAEPPTSPARPWVALTGTNGKTSVT